MRRQALRTRVAINGFGRIGRALTRVLLDRREVELVAINDPAPPPLLAAALSRDSVFGRLRHEVRAGAESLEVEGRTIRVSHATEPAAVGWPAVDVVVEATGKFVSRAAASGHLVSPVGHVVISANSADADFTACVGLNHRQLDRGRHRVISNASCTTNCIAPVAATLHRGVGVARGLMTTVHAYTAGQELVDSVRPGSDPRYARAAGVNLVPAATGAAVAVGVVVPELAGRLDGQAVRVPLANVSMVELVAQLERPTAIVELERIFRTAASEGPLVGLLGVTDEPWVSSDALADPRSAIVDLGLLQLIGDRLARVVAWYDNEWGYANRLADLIAYLGGHDETANSR